MTTSQEFIIKELLKKLIKDGTPVLINITFPGESLYYKASSFGAEDIDFDTYNNIYEEMELL